MVLKHLQTVALEINKTTTQENSIYKEKLLLLGESAEAILFSGLEQDLWGGRERGQSSQRPC